MPTTTAANLDIAERFRTAADLLEAQEASPFRVRAYRQGAATLSQLDRPVAAVYEEGGCDALETLPTIGSALAGAIAEMLETGHWRFLERLEGSLAPGSIFRQIGGIGPALAERIHDTLGVETLEELELAAHDGRLAEVGGVGDRRLQAVRESLESKLQGRRTDGDPVPVAELLDVDREYRTKAASDELRRIAPRRFNPEGEAWLPILHTARDGRHYTALFSNTARAHELDKTDDWVVIYRENNALSQWTVVTETSGPLEGERVVRGREADCRDHYQGQASAD
jgi:hypothetical protein